MFRSLREQISMANPLHFSSSILPIFEFSAIFEGLYWITGQLPQPKLNFCVITFKSSQRGAGMIKGD